MSKRKTHAHSSAEYEVGYAKPPQATRFQPGKSGNPKGRKRGSKSFVGLITRILDEPITIRLGDKLKTTTKREAAANVIVGQLLKGDPKAAAMIAALFKGTAEMRPEPVAESLDDIPAEDMALLERYLNSQSGR